MTSARREEAMRCGVVVLFAIAMAWVESAVVFYLRTMIHRLEPYQPEPFPMIGGFAFAEMVREAATLVMLFTVGVLAGKNWRTRVGYMFIAFGIWDMFYYVFLKVLCGWPHSILDWDILFLLPLPWWGPVISPVLIALLMIGWGSSTVFIEERPKHGWTRWGLASVGIVLGLYVFMEDTLRVAPQGTDAVRAVLPKKFDWALFWVGFALMSAPLLRFRKPAGDNPTRASAVPVPRPENCH